jgi:glycosyltransferase involved in cell wall biosynthesis
MACGTPAVSFRVGGVPDLVRPNITGYLAEPENALDLGKGIESLLSDPKGLASLGENCRRVAVEEFSIELQVQRYITLYESLASGSGKVQLQ